MIITTNSPEETQALGRKIGAQLQPGDVVTLSGDLGSGKTTLTKGIAQALGIEQNVTSPTFTLIQIYPIKKGAQLAHIDTYRAHNATELMGAGITDVLHNNKTISVVEWPEKISTLIKDSINIELSSQNKTHSISIPDSLLPEKSKVKIPIVYWLFLIIMIMFYSLLFKAVN